MFTLLTRLFIFSLPIFFALFGLEWYLRNRVEHNEVLAKFELVKKVDNVQTIFIGNSHGRNAFIPDLFGDIALNLCIGGSTPQYNLDLLNQIISDLPELKTVIYNLSYQSLFYNLDSLPDQRKKYEFHHYLGSDYGVSLWSPEYYSVLYTVGLKSALTTIFSDLTVEQNDWIANRGSKMESWKLSNANSLEDAAKRISNHHSLMDADKLNFNKTQLLASLDLLKKNNVETVFVVLPTSYDYRKGIVSPYLNYPAYIEDFARDNGSRFYNLSDSLNLDNTHFIDPDHLNEKGAHIVSNFLAAYIYQN